MLRCNKNFGLVRLNNKICSSLFAISKNTSSFGAAFSSSSEAVREAEVVVLALHWAHVKGAIDDLGDSIEGKILIDCTNPVKPDVSGLAVGHTSSAAEQIQMWLPQSTVVKAFNQIGFNIMENPVIEGRKTVLFVAGDDTNACKTVAQLAEDIDFEVVIMDKLHYARLLEPLAMIWISMAYKLGHGREFGFTMVRR